MHKNVKLLAQYLQKPLDHFFKDKDVKRIIGEDFIPAEYPATYAAMQTSITSDSTTKRDFFVSADETNLDSDGIAQFSKYYYDGAEAYRTYPLIDIADNIELVTWGDSLTAGQALAEQYPAQLGFITGCNVYNGGVGGQTSTQIAVRQGGVIANVTVSGGQIPASGGVTVTFPTGYEPITTQGPFGGLYGTISGVYGLLTLSGSTFTFTRLVSGSAISATTVPFSVDNKDFNSKPTIIWAGKNDPTTDSVTIKANIAAMVAHLSHTNYIVLGILTSSTAPIGSADYNNTIQTNQDLAVIYGSKFIDIRAYLLTQGTGTGQDAIDVSNGVIPSSLRVDAIHLNQQGYGLVASKINENIGLLITTSNTFLPKSSIEKILAHPVIGLPGITSFTSVNKAIDRLGLVVQGAESNNDYSGIDFVNLGRTSNPLARIAMIAKDAGSFLKFGTSNELRNGITSVGMVIDPNGKLAVGGDHDPSEVLDVYGNILVRGKITYNGAVSSWLSVVPKSTNVTNYATMLVIGSENNLGALAGDYSYPFEIQQGNSGANTNRFLISSYRRVAGSAYQGTAFRLQYAVDNSGTAGSIAYVEIGAGDPGASGGGYLAFGTNGSDVITIDNSGVIQINGTGSPLRIKAKTSTKTGLTFQNNTGAGRASFGWDPTGDVGYIGNSNAVIFTWTNGTTNPDFEFKSTGKTTFNGAIVFATVAAPANPAAGSVAEYWDGTNKKWKKSDGSTGIIY